MWGRHNCVKAFARREFSSTLDLLGRAQGLPFMMGFGRYLAGLAVLAGGCLGGCATAPAIGRGGPVYALRVTSVDGHPTSDRGPSAYPACTMQLGDRVARVWLAHPSRADVVSPVIMEADEVALKDGILVERSWEEAIVHHVTDAELAVGVAVVYVPSPFHLTVVELQFERVARLGRSQREHDFAERSPGLENPMARRHGVER
jgi:hypothetical protein